MDTPPEPQGAAADPSPADSSWQPVRQQSHALAATLRALAAGQAPRLLSACLAYANLLDELGQLAAAPERAAQVIQRPALMATPKQMKDFGRLLRDKRNQAGFSRTELARRAKLSDATIKFIETARHPPSRATLLRLTGVPELGLHWAEVPGAFGGTAPEGVEAAEYALPAAALHRFDSRLSLPLVLELTLVLDELHNSLSRVEITTPGARRACGLCGARSEVWAVDAAEAAKLPLRHAVPCAGRLAESLFQRHPVLAEVAQKERRALRSPTAAAIEASRQETPIERFHGSRSGREVTVLLARVAALPSTPYRTGVREMLLWALSLGPCPVEPADAAFTERQAQRLAEALPKGSATAVPDAARLRGVSDAAKWLLSIPVPFPGASEFGTPEACFRHHPDETADVPA